MSRGQVPSRCDYAGCRKNAVGKFPFWNKPEARWVFCAEHAKQKHHPRDIDMKRFVLFEEVHDA